MITRRQLLSAGVKAGAAALVSNGCAGLPAGPTGVSVNDVHSQLNAVRVPPRGDPRSLDACQAAVGAAQAEGGPSASPAAATRWAASSSGPDSDPARHDAHGPRAPPSTPRRDRSRWRPASSGRSCSRTPSARQGQGAPWGIVQKQTGADRLTIGGALAANVHGRGLTFQPIVDDVESFTLVDAGGIARTLQPRENPSCSASPSAATACSASITAVTLRLAPRRKVERVVRVMTSRSWCPPSSSGSPTASSTAISSSRSTRVATTSSATASSPAIARWTTRRPMPAARRSWRPSTGATCSTSPTPTSRGPFRPTSSYYLTTDGQSTGRTPTSSRLPRRLPRWPRPAARPPGGQGTEMISEIYVPRLAPGRLHDGRAAPTSASARANSSTAPSGFIERTTRASWPGPGSRTPASSSTCTPPTPRRPRARGGDFRRLIDRGLRYGGSYYPDLPPLGDARAGRSCYPQFADFLAPKRRYDPDGAVPERLVPALRGDVRRRRVVRTNQERARARRAGPVTAGSRGRLRHPLAGIAALRAADRTRGAHSAARRNGPPRHPPAWRALVPDWSGLP